MTGVNASTARRHPSVLLLVLVLRMVLMLSGMEIVTDVLAPHSATHAGRAGERAVRSVV